MAIEVELKLAIAPGDVARLRRHPLLKSLKPQRRHLHGIYFDTPDFELYRQRGAFRLRREGYHWVQTVKLDRGSVAGLSVRPEFEAQVTGNQPDFAILPEEVRGVLTEAVTRRLEPKFVTDFQRTIWLVSLPGGAVELALDVGHIRAGDKDLPVAEVELELKSGEGRVLFDAAAMLLDSVPLFPEYRSKALRGYQLAEVWREKPCKAVAAKIERGIPASEGWRRLVLAGLTQLGQNLNGLLHESDPEYLHQARVAVRRIRTMLSLGRRIDLAPQDWVDDLRWLMGEWSPARDWDVMVTETLAGAQAALPDASRLDALVASAEKHRIAANGRARMAVRDPRLPRLILDMGKGLLEPRLSGPPLEDWAAAELDRRRRRFARLARNYESLDPAGRHQLRIAAKRLRYAGEAFSSLYGGRAQDYLARVARLQDGLGAANDVAVAHGLLADLQGRDRKLALAAGLVEGFMVGVSGDRVRNMGALAAEIVAARPFWRQGKGK